MRPVLLGALGGILLSGSAGVVVGHHHQISGNAQTLAPMPYHIWQVVGAVRHDASSACGLIHAGGRRKTLGKVQRSARHYLAHNAKTAAYAPAWVVHLGAVGADVLQAGQLAVPSVKR